MSGVQGPYPFGNLFATCNATAVLYHSRCVDGNWLSFNSYLVTLEFSVIADRGRIVK